MKKNKPALKTKLRILPLNFPIRCGYHNARKGEPSKGSRANEQLLDQMIAMHSHRHTRCYGSPRMTCELRAPGIACSENRVARTCVQRACELVPGVLFTRRLPSSITRPILRPICYPKPGLLQLRVLSSLATSLTFLPGNSGSSAGYRHRSVLPRHLGRKLSDSLHADQLVDATTRAICSGLVPRVAIFHSDRGCQYSATINRELLVRHGLERFTVRRI